MLLVCGCQKVLLYAAGVRNPKEESDVKIKKYIAEFALDTNLIYRAMDTSSFVELNKISSSQSGYLFYDTKKNFLKYKNSSSACSAPVILFAQNLCSKEKDTTIGVKFHNVINLIRPVCIERDNDAAYDYYVFIFWYKYLGKGKFKSDVGDIVSSLKLANCKVKLFLVNLDLQPGWAKSIPIKIVG